MSKECNGIMYMKDKKIETLELEQAELNKQLNELISLNQQLKSTQNKVARQLLSVQNNFQIIQVDSMVGNKTITDLEKKGDYLKSQYTRLSESVQNQQTQLRQLQNKLEMYRTKLTQKQTLRQRYSKQAELNDRMIKASGKVFVQKQKSKKQLQRNQRQLNILQNNITSKNRFIGVLQKKMGVKPKKQIILSKVKSQQKFNIGDMVEDLANLQSKRMKSFDKLIRAKNSVLLKANRA